MHLLDKQNYIRYLVLFTGEITKLTKTKLSAFCLKQVELSASAVSEIFVKQEADHFTYFKQNSLNLV